MLLSGGCGSLSVESTCIMSSEFMSLSSIETLLSANRVGHTVVAYEYGKQEETISWSAFQNDVASLAACLQRHPATRISLCFNSSYLFAVSFFASCHADKALVLPGNCQAAALQELSGFFDLILHDSDVFVPPVLRAQCVNRAVKPVPYEWRTLNPGAISITLFTSGSSGRPKAIRKSLQQLDVEIAILERLWGERLADSRIASTVSHQHIYGLLFRVLWPLCAGRAFSIRDLNFPEQVSQQANTGTTLISSPALLKRLACDLLPIELCCVFSSGGPLTKPAALHAEKLFGTLPIEVFGSTETGGVAYRQQNTAQSLWRLFPGIEAQLNSEHCLRLRSPHINQDEWYQTADQCCLQSDGSFKLIGRNDRIVKIEEKRVSLAEVEKRLEQLNWIKDSAVVPMQEAHRLLLCSAIVLNDEGTEKLAQMGKGLFWMALRKALQDWLEPVAIPRKFRVVDELPLNSQGKRQVADIEKLFQA